MSNKWKNTIGLVGVVLAITLAITTLGKTAVSELAGLAVAQTNTKWNNVADAGKGDGLSSGIIASATYLFNGLTFDRLRGVPASDGSGSTGFLAFVGMLFNGSTFDRIRGGLAADASAATGLVSNQQMVFNGSTYDRVREPTTDSAAVTGFLGSATQVFNGSTWDRQRTASADNLAATGIHAAGNMGFDGSTWDRAISISNTNNTATTSQGVRYSTPLSTWSVTHTPATATQATASKALGGGTVRHVATSVTICIAANGTAQTPLLIHLRDGASGVGTIIRTWAIAAPITDSKCESVSGLNMTGSANTAMTLETAAAPVVGAQATVTLTGYSTP